MSMFGIVVGCLIGAALLFVLPPLFQRRSGEEIERAQINISIYKNQLAELETDLATGAISQEHYDKNRDEIERGLLADTAMADTSAKELSRGTNISVAAVLALAIPVGAFSLYNQIGNPDATDPEMVANAVAVSPHGDDNADMAAQIEQMVSGLAQRLEQDPSDVEGWVMLGRSLNVLGRYTEAVTAYEAALQILGDHPNVLAEYADALAMATGGSLEGRPMQILDKVLSLAPNNEQALWLVATALFERGDFAGAVSHWEQLQSVMSKQNESYETVLTNLDESRRYLARQKAGEFGDAPDPKLFSAAPVQTAATNGGASVSGLLRLSSELAAKAAPGDTVYVFAKATSGPPLPLAVLKTTVAELPLTFTLNETMAVMPTMTMAQVDQVKVEARITKTGDATRSSGDYEAEGKIVAIGNTDIELVIDKVVP